VTLVPVPSRLNGTTAHDNNAQKSSMQHCGELRRLRDSDAISILEHTIPGEFLVLFGSLQWMGAKSKAVRYLAPFSSKTLLIPLKFCNFGQNSKVFSPTREIPCFFPCFWKHSPASY
jgi:hypothetical protein